MCYKDSVNRKSNQKNIGTVKSSNLCTEIMEVSSPDETAVCNLASICLPTFLKENLRMTAPDGSHPLLFDFDKLADVTHVVTRNLNRVIDSTYYPTEAARKSNMRHRPIGIGVQGLADVFQMLGLPLVFALAITLWNIAAVGSAEDNIVKLLFALFDALSSNQVTYQYIKYKPPLS